MSDRLLALGSGTATPPASAAPAPPATPGAACGSEGSIVDFWSQDYILTLQVMFSASPVHPVHPVYPVALRLSGRPCLVVGAGRLARDKADGLVAAGAEVTVVTGDSAAEVDPGLGSPPARLERRALRPGEAAGFALVVAATGDRRLDRAVASEARAAGVLVNVADDPEACSFFLPATLRRGAVTVAVTTGGSSPAVAAWVRDLVAALLGDEVSAAAELVGQARAQLRAEGRSTAGLPWRALLDGPLRSLLAEGRPEEARDLVATWTARQRRGPATGDADGGE